MSFCYNLPYTLTDGSLILPIACRFINVIVSVIATSADNIMISCLFYGGLLSPSLSCSLFTTSSNLLHAKNGVLGRCEA